MPTYEYACTECGKHLEVVQTFSDASLTECPACQGKLRKIFGNVGVSFKGSGFYKTDSRAGSSKSAASAPAEPAKSSESTSSAAPESTTPAKPSSDSSSTASSATPTDSSSKAS